MKYFQSFALLLLTIAVAVLFYLHFSAKPAAKKESVSVKRPAAQTTGEGIRVAYIDLDSIKTQYLYFKLKSEEIEREKQKIDNEIQAALNKLEKDRVDFFKRGASITQIDAENFQRQYQERYQQLGERRELLLNRHLENQARALDDIQQKISDYLSEYNKTAKYNFIFSTGEGNLTLYHKDSTLNITPQIVEGLNEAYKKSKP